VQPVQNLRVGITTIREKWEAAAAVVISAEAEADFVLPSCIFPSNQLLESLQQGKITGLSYPGIQHAWELNLINSEIIRTDFERIRSSRNSAPIPAQVMTSNKDDIFIEPGATVYGSWLNAEEGPIYIGKNVLIMEGVSIRGPVAICEGAVVKMGTRIYGATTIGRYCTVGGEIKNTIIQDFSNKAHDGYLGDSVIGQWCNLGAGTSNSNLKNTAGEVEVWSNAHQRFHVAGKKAGLYMGDYSRAAINTSFNTGTTVGISCNVFGSGLTPGFIEDFSWGYSPTKKFEFSKAVESIRNWMNLKNKTLEDQEMQTLKHIFEQSLKTN
jgi:UDP-N-acetylglucosamine diphosphorylase/glucosamine-1-phosphate N-acetyltransferase